MINDYWIKWKKFAEKVGDSQFNIVFSLLYYVLIVPTGFLVNFFNDFLNTKGFPEWSKMENNSGSIKELKNQ